MLGLFLALGCLATAAMFFVQQGDWRMALVLFVLAEVGASGSFVFYDALLPHIARKDEIDRVSATSYALGYLGGGLLLALNFAWIRWPGAFGLPSGTELTPGQATLPSRLAFLSVSIWWCAFSVPLFLRVKEPPLERPPSGTSHRDVVRATCTQLVAMVRLIKQYPQALLMLIAYLMYNDGIGTIIKMAAIYATELGIGQEAVIGAILLVQFVGVPCTLLFGSVAGWIGTKPAILVGLSIYLGIALLGLRLATTTEFFLLAILVAVVQGGTQALSRSLFASLIPASRSAEFFAFFALSEKFAGIAGPALFALIILLTDSSRLAVAGVFPFFVIGGLLLSLVRVSEGRSRAQQLSPGPTDGFQ
jgi:UMF1 family MFS transporter